MGINWENVKDKPEGTSKQDLIKGHIKLAAKIAASYNGADKEELQSEAFLGLCEAAERYDNARGIEFGSFAQYWIRARIMQHIVNNHSQVKIGTTTAERKIFWRLRREERKFARLGIDPDPATMAEKLGVTVQDVKSMRQRLCRPEVSLQTRSDMEEGEGLSLQDKLDNGEANPEEINENKESEAIVQQAMVMFEQTLQGAESTVWQECIASDETRQGAVVAKRIRLTRQRIGQIKAELENRFVKFASDYI